LKDSFRGSADWSVKYLLNVIVFRRLHSLNLFGKMLYIFYVFSYMVCALSVMILDRIHNNFSEVLYWWDKEHDIRFTHLFENTSPDKRCRNIFHISWELALGWPLCNICVTNDHGYVPLVVNTSRSFPHSWLISGFVTR
jgi:hypothetical protein